MAARKKIPAGIPKYRYIADQIREAIRDNKLGRNNEMVADNHLMKRFDVSRGTVRQALSLLVNEGLIIREPGRGTFIQGLADKTDSQPMIRVVGWDLPSMFDHPYVRDVLFGVESVAEAEDVPLSIHPIREERLMQSSLGDFIRTAQHRMGIILIWRYPKREIRGLIRKGLPVVTVNMDYVRQGAGAVFTTVHHPEVVSEFLQRLLKIGHRRIGLLYDAASSHEMEMTLVEGFKRGYRQQKRRLTASMMIPVTEDYASVEQAIKRLRKGKNPATALMVQNEGILQNATLVLSRMGLDVPMQVSIAAFTTTSYDPFYTSMRIDQREMGRVSARMLIDMLRDPSLRPTRTVLKAVLHKGGSIAPVGGF